MRFPGRRLGPYSVLSDANSADIMRSGVLHWSSYGYVVWRMIMCDTCKQSATDSDIKLIEQ